MPRWLLAPAFAVLKRLSFRAGFMLAGFLFLLPTGLAIVLAPLEPASLALLGLLSLLAIYMLASVQTYMSFGVGRLIRVTERIAAGELSHSRGSVGDSSRNEDSSRLWDSILKMSGNLGDIVRQVRASGDAIALAARDIAEGNNHLAERTQEQAAALEQAASGMEELAAAAQQNASHCRQADTLAESAREVAAKAAAEMERVASTMRQIDASAQRVGDILGTVEGIAFQTNILALNAAVESARAGEHGRGFAVVAGEVRTLAQRSAQAAKEIKALIEQSVSNAGQGRKLVEGAAGTMAQVVGSVEQVGQLIGEIARASAEQSSGIEAINEAVVQIDSANQQNAALVEEASAAAAAFEQEAAQLAEVVRRFKLDRGDDRGRAVALVKEGAAHVKHLGVQKACADLNDPRGRFAQGEYYVFAIDMQGVRLAFSPDPRSVGTNVMDQTDAEGFPLGRHINAMARNPGFGWIDYKYLNPKTGRIQPKSVYIERVGDVILGCGIYLGADGPQAAGPVPAARLPRVVPQLAGARGR